MCVVIWSCSRWIRARNAVNGDNGHKCENKRLGKLQNYWEKMNVFAFRENEKKKKTENKTTTREKKRRNKDPEETCGKNKFFNGIWKKWDEEERETDTEGEKKMDGKKSAGKKEIEKENRPKDTLLKLLHPQQRPHKQLLDLCPVTGLIKHCLFVWIAEAGLASFIFYHILVNWCWFGAFAVFVPCRVLAHFAK